MKKALKIILKAVSGIIIFIIMLPIVISIVLQLSIVQNFVVGKASEVLSEISNTKISIGHIALDFFTSARFEQVYMEDHRGDTMIYVDNIKVSIRGINFISGKISIGTTTLKGAKVNLYKDSTGVMNISQVFENFAPEVPNPDPPTFQLTAAELNLLDTRFTMTEYGVKKKEFGVNYQDLHLRDITFQARNINVYNHNIWLSLEHLSFKEQSGFNLQHISSTRCGVDSSGMHYADVVLESGHTLLQLDSLNFLTANQSWWDWNDFGNNMIISALMGRSELSTQTLSYLIGLKLKHSEIIDIGQARIDGSISNLRGKLSSIKFAGSELWADFSIKGLPDIDNTLLDLNITKLNTNAAAVDKALQRITGTELEAGVYNTLYNLGNTELSLHSKGTLKELNSSFKINSHSSGVVEGECILTRGKADQITLGGRINTTDLHIGEILDVEKLGLISLSGKFGIKIKPNHPIILNANLDIAKLHYGAYDFHDIKVDGEFESRRFNGLISCDDHNFNFDLTGLLNFTTDIPQYKVEVNLYRADLFAIGVNPRDSISILSTKISANASGSELDEFNGSGVIDKIEYITSTDTLRTGIISITSTAEPNYKELDIRSHFADIRLRGRHSFSEIGRYLSQSMKRFLPSFPEVSTIVNQQEWSKASKGKRIIKKGDDASFSDGYYQLTLEVKEANNVASIFVPTLEVAKGSSLNFFFNPYLDQLTLRAKSDYVASDNFFVEYLNIDAKNHLDSLSVFTTAELIAIKDFEFPNFSLIGGIHNNTITIGAQFREDNGATSALINTTTILQRKDNGTPELKIDIHPTAVVIDSARWSISHAELIYDNKRLEINNFGIYSGNEKYLLNGILGPAKSDTLYFDLDNANLFPVTYFISDLGYTINGHANGKFKSIATLSDSIEMYAIIDFDNIELSGQKLGSPQLRSTIDRANSQINFTLGNDLAQAPITGFYNIKHKEFGAQFKLDKLPLAVLDPLLAGIMIDGSGNAKVDLELRAKGGDVSLNGEIDIENYGTTVEFTRARYYIPSGKVIVKNSSFSLAPTPINDGLQGAGQIRAELNTESFKNLRYDIGVTFTDLLALNTTIKDNASFFGKAYGTGRVEVKGNDKATSINVTAETALNSEVILPLSGSSTIESADYITFVNPKADTVTVDVIRHRHLRRLKDRTKAKKSTNDLDIRLNLAIKSNTEAQIELDAKVGDIIKARGEGNLMMHINPLADIFTMTGPVEITQGSYLFTLQTIINKRFTVEQGSKILWTGDPVNPDIDLTALYKVKTSITPLSGSDSDNGQVNIDCGIELDGKLLTPNINFSIAAPSADPEVQNIIRNAINTQEALSMQFISLMLANSFMPNMSNSAIGTIGSSLAGVTAVEFLSNQISNLISSDKFNIRFGYKPQSDTSSDEFSAGVGTDLIANVLTLEVDGNYNTQTNSVNNSGNPFTVDAYLTWSINKRRTLKIKGFTRTVDRFDESQGMQESGVGIYFLQDFNNLPDLKRRLKLSFQRDSTSLALKEVRKELRKQKRAEEKAERKAAKLNKEQKSDTTAHKQDSTTTIKKDSTTTIKKDSLATIKKDSLSTINQSPLTEAKKSEKKSEKSSKKESTNQGVELTQLRKEEGSKE